MNVLERINQHRCRVASSYVPAQYTSDDSYGFNGMFRLTHNGQMLRVIISDGMGWKHVSVSIEGDKRPPKWDVMCFIKDLFFEPEDCVIQFHPPKSEYVEDHPGCLHLWQPTDQTIPMPPSIMVGRRKKF